MTEIENPASLIANQAELKNVNKLKDCFKKIQNEYQRSRKVKMYRSQ
jgi:hypothetical protein